MFTDRYTGPEYVIGEPVMPELIRFNLEFVTPDVLAQFRLGYDLPREDRGTVYNYNNFKIINVHGREQIIDNGFESKVVWTLTAEDVDRVNSEAILRRWTSESPTPSWLPFMSLEFQKRHLGSTNRVYIGFFERAVRRVRGLSNDVWRYQPPTLSQESTPPLAALNKREPEKSGSLLLVGA